MNKRLQQAALQTPTGDDGSQAVLATLARLSNAAGETGMRLHKLAAATGLSGRAVDAALKQLKELGFISARDGTRGVVHRVHLATPSALPLETSSDV
ncbi:hypothetical protein [Luteolibacter soli]|uniref:MarR family transcriptional regulator n=1 Tax=Luteolibacter soli TaxID=3135280 RepID=A0ABU9AZI1_9BACT